MRTQWQLLKAMIITVIVSLIASIITSILYFKFSKNVLYSIINNISICIFTGCIIGLIQAIIGYINSKRNALLSFYKECIMLEKEIIRHPYMHSGFVKIDDGYKDIQLILDRFNDNYKIAWMEIYSTKHSGKVIIAAKQLYSQYCQHILPYRHMEDALCEAIRFNEQSDELLLSKGIDIDAKTNEIQKNIDQCELNIQKQYNDDNEQKKRSHNYEVIENYLFSKKGNEKK